jgi:hypothetical protein
LFHARLESLEERLALTANDNFADAEVVSGTSASTTGSNFDATVEMGEPTTNSDIGRSVWYQWTAPTDGQFQINTLLSDFDTVLAVYTGSTLATLKQIAFNDDDTTGPGARVTSLVEIIATAGTLYHIQVDGFSGATGNIQVNLAQHAPWNDNFTDRVVIDNYSSSSVGSNVLATLEAGEPVQAAGGGGHSIWWTYTAPISARVHLDTAGSDFNTVLAVYTGDPVNGLTLVAKNDDSGPGLTSKLELNIVAGTTYQIQVDGYNAAAVGDVKLNYWLLPAASILGRVSSGQWYSASSTNGSTSFTNAQVAQWNGGTWTNVMNGDFNGDHHIDLIGRDGGGRWMVSLNEGYGYFFNPTQFGAWSVTVTWSDVQVADVNGDGFDDIVGRLAATGQWYVAFSNGMTFTNAQTLVWNRSFNWVDVHVLDMNDDGRADIIGRNASNGQWNIGLSNGATFNNSVWSAWSTTITWLDIRVGDINGDQRPDVVGRVQQNGAIYVALNQANNTFSSGFLWATWSTAGSRSNVNLIDINDDGRADLVQLYNGTTWVVSLSTGSSFAGGQVWGTWNAGTYVDVLFADYDGDGRVDIAGRNNGAWWVMRNNGGTSFNTAKVWTTWNNSIARYDVQAAAVNGYILSGGA